MKNLETISKETGIPLIEIRSFLGLLSTTEANEIYGEGSKRALESSYFEHQSIKNGTTVEEEANKIFIRSDAEKDMERFRASCGSNVYSLQARETFLKTRTKEDLFRWALKCTTITELSEVYQYTADEDFKTKQLVIDKIYKLFPEE